MTLNTFLVCYADEEKEKLLHKQSGRLVGTKKVVDCEQDFVLFLTSEFLLSTLFSLSSFFIRATFFDIYINKSLSLHTKMSQELF